MLMTGAGGGKLRRMDGKYLAGVPVDGGLWAADPGAWRLVFGGRALCIL